MAKDHWEYVQGVMMVHGIDPITIDQCGSHYQDAFVHGYKHGVESTSSLAGQCKDCPLAVDGKVHPGENHNGKNNKK